MIPRRQPARFQETDVQARRRVRGRKDHHKHREDNNQPGSCHQGKCWQFRELFRQWELMGELKVLATSLTAVPNVPRTRVSICARNDAFRSCIEMFTSAAPSWMRLQVGDRFTRHVRHVALEHVYARTKIVIRPYCWNSHE